MVVVQSIMAAREAWLMLIGACSTILAHQEAESSAIPFVWSLGQSCSVDVKCHCKDDDLDGAKLQSLASV